MLEAFMAGTLGMVAGETISGQSQTRADSPQPAPLPTDKEITGDPRVRGPFPILSTPYTESGDVDYEVLAKSARFVDWCGCSGMIWPQSGDSIDLLTMDEKLKGMEVLAQTMKGRKTALCLGVQGKTIDEMLVYARHVEKLEPTAIISRPMGNAKTDDELRDYWHALMEVVHRPVIIQTAAGGCNPSVQLLKDLGAESPYFGYVKEETKPIMQRMKELVAAKPVIKCVFSAMGGFAWLHQCRIGTEGLITERAVYADLLMKIWNSYECGDLTTASDAFGKFLLMLNLRETIPCQELRGYHLYVWQKRGVFKNRLSREYGPGNSIPEKPIIANMELSQESMDEIDMRFETLKPFLKEGTFTDD